MEINVIWAACIVGAGLTLGCSEPVQRVPVSGRVVVDGQPLTSGAIRFVPEKGRPASSTILPDGSFQLGDSSVGNERGVDGVAPGKYRIAVSASKILNEEKESIKWLAPRHYADHRTSGLEVDVQRPEDDLLVELTWEEAAVAEDDASSEGVATKDADPKEDDSEADEESTADDESQ